MQKRQLGKTSLQVSQLGFGAASIGNLYKSCDDKKAREVVTTSYDLGINYFDTAPEYGHGLSERRLGDALRDYPRNDYVLSTKVGDVLYAMHNQLPPENKFINKLPFFLRFDYSYDGVMRAFEDSLQRLGLNRIDIIFVHDLDPVIHDKDFAECFKIYVESGYKALDKLRQEGVIQAIGLGVKKTEVCADALRYGDYECFMLQGNYTLLDQSLLTSGFADECLKKNISILQAGPFASGILATGAVKGAHFNHSAASDDILNRVKKIQEICQSFNTPLQAVAIQFPLHHPVIASVVVGTSSAESMRENVNFAEFTIPPALWDALKTANIIPANAPIN